VKGLGLSVKGLGYMLQALGLGLVIQDVWFIGFEISGF
jgi:hypothetical protein